MKITGQQAGISGMCSLSALFEKMTLPVYSSNEPSALTSVRLLILALNGDYRAGLLSPPENCC